MNWERLKIFYTVASLGSLSGAEQALHITQSALSRQISQLEHEVRTKLFERHARGLRLTEAGQSLYCAVKTIYHDLLVIQTQLAEQQDLPEGNLTIIAPRAFCTFWLMPHIAEFSKKHPKITISLVSDELLSANHTLHDGVYIQISSNKPDEASELIHQKLCTVDFGIYAGHRYLDHQGTPKSARDLDKHWIIAQNRFTSLTGAENAAINPLLFAGKEASSPRVPHLLVDDTYSQLMSVESNMGIATLPRYVSNRSKNMQELSLRLPETIPDLSYYLIYPDHLKDFKRIRLFIDFLRDKAPETYSQDEINKLTRDTSHNPSHTEAPHKG